MKNDEIERIQARARAAIATQNLVAEIKDRVRAEKEVASLKKQIDALKEENAKLKLIFWWDNR